MPLRLSSILYLLGFASCINVDRCNIRMSLPLNPSTSAAALFGPRPSVWSFPIMCSALALEETVVRTLPHHPKITDTTHLWRRINYTPSTSGFPFQRTSAPLCSMSRVDLTSSHRLSLQTSPSARPNDHFPLPPCLVYRLWPSGSCSSTSPHKPDMHVTHMKHHILLPEW